MLDIMFELKANTGDSTFIRFCAEDKAGKYLIFEHENIIYHRKSKSKLMKFDGNDWVYLGIYMELYLNENKKEIFELDKLHIMDELGLSKRVNYLAELIVDMKNFIINPDIKILTKIEEEDET